MKKYKKITEVDINTVYGCVDIGLDSEKLLSLKKIIFCKDNFIVFLTKEGEAYYCNSLQVVNYNKSSWRLCGTTKSFHDVGLIDGLCQEKIWQEKKEA